MSNTEATLKSLLRIKNMRLSQLAKALKLNKSSVTRWAKTKVPGERCIEVEIATGIPREFLRPDLYGVAPKPVSKPRGKRPVKEAAE